MSAARAALAAEYRELLRAQGLEHLVGRTATPAEEALLIARITEQAQRSAADYGERNLLPPEPPEPRGGGPRDRYAATSARIERAIRELSGELPGPVYVGEYPHRSFNAEALAARHGTLLLINTGLHYLLVEVALALNTRVRVAERRPDGGYDVQPTTPAMERRRRHADENLVSSLAAYLLHTDPGRGGKQEVDGTTRGALSYLYAGAAETFAVAHEYGHFLAGHLTRTGRRPSGAEWLRKSHDQEFEADEIGMLLALKALEYDEQEQSPLLRKSVAVTGTFLFFAVDHLLNRVRDEVPELGGAAIVADHPPSDARAATLRRTLTELEGPDIFQLVDATIPILAEHETEIIANLRRLLRAAK
ncbi:hypothetical protein AB0C12_32730 [Actinoplanes sp. NPDC048967]|uniref:hypothetical protein n=1 Tax=Actinoplanes sp. NPDC048967 TaxID=3155269 RepID=UPI0033C91E29